ncbi:MAG: 5-deoxy-glucuronate isomerase, partial [Propionivibrio sp.]
MKIKQDKPFSPGYNPITSHDGEHRDMMMDFGILKLSAGLEFSDEYPLERIFLLLYGEIEIRWADQREIVSRGSFLDDNLWCLNVPQGVAVTITGVSEDSEVAVIRTENERVFKPAIRCGEAITKEIRGQGSMNDAGTRIVR